MAEKEFARADDAGWQLVAYRGNAEHAAGLFAYITFRLHIHFKHFLSENHKIPFKHIL